VLGFKSVEDSTLLQETLVISEIAISAVSEFYFFIEQGFFFAYARKSTFFLDEKKYLKTAGIPVQTMDHDLDGFIKAYLMEFGAEKK